ncbi:MAG: hypothetical protein LBT08_11390, partial [Synergistaceae bacterium]|nr:hypothetical protein [Synergistaceae bacterium]
MTRFHGYSRLPDLGKILREAAASHVNRRKIYMLPSMSNEEILLDMLRGSDSYFGEKPEAWSWAGMYSRLVPRGDLRRGIDPPDQSMILRHLIGQTLADLDSRGMTVPHGVRRRGFLEILSAAIRELLLEDVPPDRLLYGPSKGSEKRGAEPRELLYSIYSDYLAYLEDNGLADNSQMPALTRESVMSTRPDYLDSCVIYWVGFMSFTGAQLRLIKELNGLVDRWGMDLEMEFYTPDSGLEGFRDAASQLGLVSSGQYEKGGMIVSVEASDAFEQYDAIAMEIAMARAGSGELADILNGLTRSDQGRIDALLDIGIMADPHKVQLITSALRRRGVGFQQRSEVQVSETAVIEFCRRAWEAYSRGWPTRRTSHILRHPLFGVSSLDEKRSAVELPEGIESWRKFLSGVEGDSSTPSSLKNLESLNSFCEYLNDPRGHVREEILGALLALADDGEWESRLAAEVGKYAELDGAVRLVSSTRLEIAEKLEMMREQRPALGEAGDQRFSGVDALDCLLEWARGATTALQQPQSNVVVLYDSPPPVLAEHSIWIMTDVDPSRFPGSMSGQALLDADLRDNVNRRVDDSDDAVHLPTFHEKREQQEALFRRLLSVGSVVTIIARSASDSEGRPQEDSPFVQALFSDAASRWVRLAHIAGAAWSSLESERAGLYAIDRGKFPRVATDDLRMPAKVRSEKIRVAPSHIDDWLQCPFSYWCGHVARIEAPRDDVGLYDKIIQGALMHATWKGVWERYLSH